MHCRQRSFCVWNPLLAILCKPFLREIIFFPVSRSPSRPLPNNEIPAGCLSSTKGQGLGGRRLLGEQQRWSGEGRKKQRCARKGYLFCSNECKKGLREPLVPKILPNLVTHTSQWQIAGNWKLKSLFFAEEIAIKSQCRNHSNRIGPKNSSGNALWGEGVPALWSVSD